MAVLLRRTTAMLFFITNFYYFAKLFGPSWARAEVSADAGGAGGRFRVFSGTNCFTSFRRLPSLLLVLDTTRSLLLVLVAFGRLGSLLLVLVFGFSFTSFSHIFTSFKILFPNPEPPLCDAFK